MTVLLTPREAILQAENERLKAENGYLRAALGLYGTSMKIEPYGVIDSLELSEGFLPSEIRLPMTLYAKGALMRTGVYSVVVGTKFAGAEDIQVGYYCDAREIKSKRDYAINELLPYLHEKFIYALTKAMGR